MVWRRRQPEKKKPKALRGVGKAILKARGALRLHQSELGAQAGVSFRTIARWENGYRVPTEKQLDALLRAVIPYDEELAETIAAAAGASLVSLGLVTPPPPPPPARVPPSKESVEHAVFLAAEEIDVAPARMRMPMAKLLRRLDALGATWEEAAALIAPAPAATKKRRD
jgi:transcriptional regulator with XRE-family HTH domain